MAQPNLTVLRHTAWNAKTLESDANGFRRFRCRSDILFDSNGSPHSISPAGIFKRDRLYGLYDIIRRNTGFSADISGLPDGSDTILIQYAVDFIYAALITFK